MLHVTEAFLEMQRNQSTLDRQEASNSLRHWLLVLQEAQPKTTALHQAAWMLQIAALQLHRADMAVVSQRENARTLLHTLFGAPVPDEGKPSHFICFYCLHLSTWLLIHGSWTCGSSRALLAKHIPPQPFSQS